MVVESRKDWKLLKLNDIIVDIIDYRGKTPKKLGGDWSESGIIALSAMNVKQGQLVNLEKAKFVSEELYRKWMKSEVRQCDILMTSEAPLGETYFVARKRKICLSQRLYCIRANPDVVQPRWLFYALSSQSTKNQLNLRATGTTVLGIRQPDLREIPITVPPLPTQHKIAAILGNYDDLIENNTRRIKILEEMAGTIYREWFVEFRFPGHENVKMVESELGLIPEGWGVKQLGEMCDVVMGQSPKSEFYNESGEGLPFHQGVTDFGDRFPTDRVYCTIQNRIANPGDILFSVRAPVGRINVADKKIVIGRGLSAIRCKDGNQVSLLQQLKDRFTEEDTMGVGTIFNAIRKSDLLEIQLLAPPDSLIAEFEEIAAPISSLLGNLTKENVNLRRTRDMLLPKLISGDLDVSNLDIGTDLYRSQEGEKSYAA